VHRNIEQRDVDCHAGCVRPAYLVMSRVERLTVTLPSEMAHTVRAAVDAGEYSSASELVEEALAAWANGRELQGREIEALKAAYVAGKASGEPRAVDIERVIGQARARPSAAERG
jgi:antitoxin ParD1/3/4